MCLPATAMVPSLPSSILCPLHPFPCVQHGMGAGHHLAGQSGSGSGHSQSTGEAESGACGCGRGSLRCWLKKVGWDARASQIIVPM